MPAGGILKGSKTKRVKIGDQELEVATLETPEDMEKMGEKLEKQELDFMTPTQVKGLTKVSEIASNRDHNCAITESGQVWCWGRNHKGQLGDGTTEDRNEPVRVEGIEGAVAIAVGDNNGCAVIKDGAVWCWGNNESGVLGSEPGQATSPVKIAAFGDI